MAYLCFVFDYSKNPFPPILKEIAPRPERSAGQLCSHRFFVFYLFTPNWNIFTYTLKSCPADRPGRKGNAHHVFLLFDCEFGQLFHLHIQTNKQASVRLHVLNKVPKSPSSELHNAQVCNSLDDGQFLCSTSIQ